VGALPPGGAACDAATFFQRERFLASHVWQLLLEPMANRGPKAAMAMVQNVVQELASVVLSPEWPGAELLLHVLVLQLLALENGLSGKKPMKVSEFGKEDREMILELLGFVTSVVRLALWRRLCASVD
jgi:hypothetical protein